MVKEEVDVHYFLPSAVYCYALQGLHHFTLTSHIINLMSSILSFSLHVGYKVSLVESANNFTWHILIKIQLESENCLDKFNFFCTYFLKSQQINMVFNFVIINIIYFPGHWPDRMASRGYQVQAQWTVPRRTWVCQPAHVPTR